MFESLSEKLEVIFKKLRSRGKLNEQNIKEALKEVKMALLEADVNFKVVKEFISKVEERAVGQEVLGSLTPGQQVIKIVNDELISLMGKTGGKINLSSKPPTTIMLVGLHGSGKTTTVAKLAKSFKEDGHKVLLVPADVYRPAAIQQLQVLGETLNVDVYNTNQKDNPVSLCQEALGKAETEKHDIIIIDTAGRFHVDEDLMNELKDIKKVINPHEVLLVADAMTGQDAVNVAKGFHQALTIDGIILTKMDGDSRGGAALSICTLTNRPIKFIGVGEKVDDLEIFHPERMASRILGMGDILSLVERAEASFDKEKAKELEKKIRRDSLTLEDFREQLQKIKNMGPLDQLMGMVPGLGKLKGAGKIQTDNGELVKMEAIINSMTYKERINHTIINGNRRKRIAQGSGTTVQDVNRLLKQFVQMQKMMKGFAKGMGKMKGRRSLMPF